MPLFGDVDLDGVGEEGANEGAAGDRLLKSVIIGVPSSDSEDEDEDDNDDGRGFLGCIGEDEDDEDDEEKLVARSSGSGRRW